MSKDCYVVVDGATKKIKKRYVVVDGVTKKANKKYVVVDQHTVPAVDLPEEYTQLDYIESTGDQYVDTGFKPNQNTRILMDVDGLGSSQSDQFLFGARIGYMDTAVYVVLTASGDGWLLGYADVTQYKYDARTCRHTIDYDQNTIAIDGIINHSFTATTFALNYSMYLFACNQSDTAIAGKYAIMQLYSCKIYDNGTLVRDYVPCKNASGTPGLYDMVNSTFVSSAKSTPFVAGTAQGNVTKLVYESID